MRTVVFDRDLVELDVKPSELLKQYRKLLESEVKKFPLDRRQSCFCPVCRLDEGEPAFEKYGYVYRLCPECRSLYVSPRPSQEALDAFYRGSESSRFWREHILTETRDTRRIKLFRPLAQWILDVLDEHRPDAGRGAAVGYHNELLLEELNHQEQDIFPVLVTNALADIEFAGQSLPWVTIEPTAVSDLPDLGPVDVFFVFDYLDRCADPDSLFGAMAAALSEGGLVLANATLVSGFDLQVLWERSESIYPPERLNLFSTEGLKTLYERHGFRALEFSTPGNFDVEIVRRAITDEPDGEWPRFIRYMVENRDETAQHEFQDFLQRHLLSSFGRIALTKRI